jgi:WD40 repeat protein
MTLTLTPDGKTLATGEDGVVRLWDLETGKVTRSFSFPDVFWVRAVTFSPDGKRLAVIGDHRESYRFQERSHSLFVCDAATGRTLYQFREDDGGFMWPWFSPDGKLLAAARRRTRRTMRPQEMVFWEADTGKQLRAIDGVAWWTWSPDGKVLAGVKVSFDGIHLWDVATGKELRCLPDRGTADTVLAFSPDGKTLAATRDMDPPRPAGKEADKVIYLWDVATREERLRITARWHRLYQLTFAPDGTTLALMDLLGGISLWDAGTGKPRDRTGSGLEECCSGFAFSPDGKRLYARTTGGMHEWDAATAKVTRRLADSLESDGFLATPDGRRLVGDGEALSVWDLTTGKLLGPAGGHRAGVEAVLFSPDGRALASLDRTRRLGLWDTATGKPLVPSLDGGSSRCVAMSLAPDGRGLIAVGYDAAVRTWDFSTGRVAREFSAGGEAMARAWRKFLGSLAYLEVGNSALASISRDGRTLAVADNSGAVQFWDTTTGKQQGRLERAAALRHMAFSPGGQYLAIQAGKDVIEVWDTKAGKKRPEYQTEGGSGDFLFSADDRFMAWCKDSRIHLCDLVGGKEAAQLDGEDDPRLNFTFLRGGKIFVYWDRDKKLALWDVSRGALLRTVAACPRDSRDARLIPTPDGGALVYCLLEEDRPVFALCDVFTGREVCRTRGWREEFVASPDGRVLVQAGSGIVFRELATGAVVGRLDEAHRCRVKSLVFSPDGRTLASVGGDCTVLVWDYAAAVGLGGSPGPADLDATWSDLAGEDAARAWRAIGALAASGDKAVSFLRGRLQPVSAKEHEALLRWVAGLDSDDFDGRELATRELAKRRWEAEPVLLNALVANPSAEARARIERLLSGAPMGQWPSEAMRKHRAVFALERIATPAARGLLEQLAEGAPDARLTQEAKASSGRLAKRHEPAP